MHLDSLRIALALVLFTMVAARAAHAAVPITTCAQTLNNFDNKVVLANDLDCAANQAGILIGGGIIDLGGFKITGATTAVLCTGGCNVSNGTLVNNIRGVVSNQGHARLINVTVDGGDTAAIGPKGVVLKNVEFNNLSHGFLSTLGGAKLLNVHQNGGLTGGLAAKSIKAVDSIVTGPLHYGLRGDKVRLTRSSVTGSGSDPGCNLAPAFDTLCGSILAWKTPVLKISSRDTSVVLGVLPPTSWAVCTSD